MRGVWIMALLAWCTAAQAHKPSDSYVRVALQGLT